MSSVSVFIRARVMGAVDGRTGDRRVAAARSSWRRRSSSSSEDGSERRDPPVALQRPRRPVERNRQPFRQLFGGLKRGLADLSYAEMSDNVDTAQTGFDIEMKTGAAIGSRA